MSRTKNKIDYTKPPHLRPEEGATLDDDRTPLPPFLLREGEGGAEKESGIGQIAIDTPPPAASLTEHDTKQDPKLDSGIQSDSVFMTSAASDPYTASLENNAANEVERTVWKRPAGVKRSASGHLSSATTALNQIPLSGETVELQGRVFSTIYRRYRELLLEVRLQQRARVPLTLVVTELIAGADLSDDGVRQTLDFARAAEQRYRSEKRVHVLARVPWETGSLLITALENMRIAGHSEATVSRYLNGLLEAGPQTADEIWQMVHQLI